MSGVGGDRESEGDGWQLVLDPCTATGRFLLDLAWHHRDKKVALFGVELDLDLYRACLVNMKLYAFGMPYFILRADALIVDLMPASPNWRFANRWHPPAWETEMVTPNGVTFAEWKEEDGVEEMAGRSPVGVEAGLRKRAGVEALPLFRA